MLHTACRGSPCWGHGAETNVEAHQLGAVQIVQVVDPHIYMYVYGGGSALVPTINNQRPEREGRAILKGRSAEEESAGRNDVRGGYLQHGVVVTNPVPVVSARCTAPATAVGRCQVGSQEGERNHREQHKLEGHLSWMQLLRLMLVMMVMMVSRCVFKSSLVAQAPAKAPPPEWCGPSPRNIKFLSSNDATATIGELVAWCAETHSYPVKHPKGLGLGLGLGLGFRRGRSRRTRLRARPARSRGSV